MFLHQRWFGLLWIDMPTTRIDFRRKDGQLVSRLENVSLP
jgi:hypothetical protein